MLQLPQEYKVKGQRGFIYRQVKRIGDVIIAAQFQNEKGEQQTTPVSYEVFVVQKYPDRMSPDGKIFIPAKETPPRSELWGSIGFSCGSLESAEERMAELLERYPAKEEVKPAEPVKEKKSKTTKKAKK